MILLACGYLICQATQFTTNNTFSVSNQLMDGNLATQLLVGVYEKYNNGVTVTSSFGAEIHKPNKYSSAYLIWKPELWLNVTEKTLVGFQPVKAFMDVTTNGSQSRIGGFEFTGNLLIGVKL